MSRYSHLAAATGSLLQQPLSSLIADPFVRVAFERAERDFGSMFAILPVREPELEGGAAEPIELEMAII